MRLSIVFYESNESEPICSFKFDKNIIQQYHTVIYHSPFITMLCKLQGTNQSDKINISTIDFLVAQELSWFGPRTL